MTKFSMAVMAVGFWGCGGVQAGVGQCGPGTVLEGEVCVSTGLSPCQGGMVLVGNQCVPVLACGAGTFAQDGQCVPQGSATQATCAAGTTLVGTECQPALAALCSTDTRVSGGACVSALSCGTGTARSGDQCVSTPANLSCGSGTVLSGSSCVVSLAQVCGTDTVSSGGHCVSALACGSGTSRSGNQCVGTTATVTCGAGTVLSGTTCVAIGGAVTCGPGTVQCIPAPLTTGTVGSFIGSSGLARAAYVPSPFNDYTKRLILSELTQGNADAWANIAASMVGTGRALHLLNVSSADVSPGAAAVYFTVKDWSNGGSLCSSSVTPTSSGLTAGAIAVNFFSWSGGVATPVACGKQGTVKAEHVFNSTLGRYVLTLTLNVVFTDGSTLTDAELSF